ncbi:hypothetical protein QAD02_001173 [Eretmocerus hayati]|uniref:Uncharacterized protein n=1 Tax=Eretmocerus hayati TaxID=131215 RepID=A0ACC2NFQ0_9HYME|nr:hypothetical protein QAD02_001173 [Eretmocerus hayati]
MKCFKRAAFPLKIGIDENRIGITDCEDIIQILPTGVRDDIMSIEEVYEMESRIVIHEDMPTTTDDIMRSILQSNESADEQNAESDVDDESTQGDDVDVSPPSHEEILALVSKLIRYASHHDNASTVESSFKVQNDIENAVYHDVLKLIQAKITHFFSSTSN